MDVEAAQLDFPAPAPFTVTQLYHAPQRLATSLQTIFGSFLNTFVCRMNRHVILWLTH